MAMQRSVVRLEEILVYAVDKDSYTFLVTLPRCKPIRRRVHLAPNEGLISHALRISIRNDSPVETRPLLNTNIGKMPLAPRPP